METLYKKVNGQRVELSEEEANSIRQEWETAAQEKIKNKYKEDRQQEYNKKSLEDQLDSFFTAVANAQSLTDITNAEIVQWRMQIKADYPKPVGE